MPDAPARILVVDDEPSITEFVGYALRKEGFSVDVVDNGEDALSRAMKNDYDLFVLDIMLPGLSGKVDFARTPRPPCYSSPRATASSTRSLDLKSEGTTTCPSPSACAS